MFGKNFHSVSKPLHSVDIRNHFIDIPLHSVDIQNHFVDISLHSVDIPLHSVDIPLHSVDIQNHFVDIPFHLVDIRNPLQSQPFTEKMREFSNLRISARITAKKTGGDIESSPVFQQLRFFQLRIIGAILSPPPPAKYGQSRKSPHVLQNLKL